MSDQGIFRISKDKVRAKDIYETALERYSFIKIIPRDKIFKIVEEHYETIKELLTAVIYLDGFKTLGHIELIEYFKNNYKELSISEIRLVDDLRKIRHGIMYYGKKVNEAFLINNEAILNKIISKLFELVRKKLA